MTDFNHFNYEYQTLSNHFTNRLDTLDLLKTYYESIVKGGREFYNSFIKASEKRSNKESKAKNNKNSDLWLKMGSAFELEKKAVEHFFNWLNMFEDDIIKNLNKQYEELTIAYNENLNSFKRICETIVNSHEDLEKLKNKYFEEKQLLHKLITKKNNGKEGNSNKKEENQKNDQIEKVLSLANLYKNQTDETNLLIDKKESEYQKINKKNKEIEESNLLFFKETFMKVNSLFESLNNKLLIQNIFEGYSVSSDMEKYYEEFKFTNSVKRIERENYNTLRERNDETTHLSSPEPNLTNYNTVISTIVSSAGEGYFSSFDSEMFEYYTYPVSDGKQYQDYDKIIEPYVSRILLKDTIPFEIIQSIKEQCSNKYFIISFLDMYHWKYKETGYRFLNMENFNIFGRLLIQMINSLDLTRKKSYSIITSIIFISEWSHYENVFLCSILGKCSFFKVSKTWKKIIDYRLLHKLQYKVKEILADPEKANSKGFFGYFFKKNKQESIDDDQSTNIKKYGFDTRLKHYSKLKPNQLSKIDKYFESCVNSTLKEYIEILSNFNFDLNEGIQLIVEMSINYSLPSDKIKIYLLLFNISSRTIRKWSFNERKPDKNALKIKDIINKSDTSILIKYPGTANTNKQKEIILWEVSHFMPLKDQVNLLCLNKQISKNLKIKLYKKLLRSQSKDTSDKYRMIIWKIVLHLNDIVSKINYESYITEATSAISNDCNIIELDVSRTYFPKNVELNKQRSVRILKCLIYLKPEIKYYQGMNYIAAFFLRATDNEEEAFYFILSLFETTDFGLMFNQDFQMINSLLLIFEKLLLLKIPSVYYILKENNIASSCYVTPWIITLFSNILQNMRDEKLTNVLFNIWDDFILSGWKGLMRAILAIIDYHKEEIVVQNEEGLYIFMINGLSKTQCLNEDNYEKWLKIKKNIDISSKLIKDIEEQIQLEHLFE